MQTISLGFGAANFKNSSAKLIAYHVAAPFLRTFATKTLKGRTPSTFPVSNTPHIEGTLYVSQVPDVPDGEIICLQNSLRRHSRPYADYAIFIRTRADGASYRIRGIVPASASSVLPFNNHIMFLGRGDILDLNEVRDAGITPHGGFVSGFMDASELPDCFQIEELAPAIAAAPKIERIQHDDGEVTTIVRTHSARRMRVRRG